ncbi:MAG: type I methionyl aminopeptidase [bacterium]|nr:type I methionyl aminopeptidase [bacterium]
MITYKTNEEIEILREGGRRLACVVEAASQMVAPGITTKEIDARVKQLIEDGGDTAAFLGYTPDGANRPFPGAICISVNDEVVHGVPGGYALQGGDIVGLDCGLLHKGLYTDHAVTVPVGRVEDTLLELISVTKEALAVGIAHATPGCYIGDISHAIQEVLEAHRYGIVRELAGHGVGYKVHEEPYVPNYGKKGTGPLLKTGMVLALEPMATLGRADIETDEDDGYTIRTVDRSMAAHFEHTIAITKNGPEILTT